jgi:hypothetical protein
MRRSGIPNLGIEPSNLISSLVVGHHLGEVEPGSDPAGLVRPHRDGGRFAAEIFESVKQWLEASVARLGEISHFVNIDQHMDQMLKPYLKIN